MTNVTDKIDQYEIVAKRYLTKNREWAGLENLSEEEFAHVCNIGKSILLTRDGILQGGSFVQAVVNNDLKGAINRADATCIKALKGFVALNHNCDIFYH
jgi:hypothetical protein